ncbi:MAG: C40 family peptidase [Planctomycetes bacterium]|nr:C40 family peptidase [Planctomycetota bacterium]
MLHRLATVVALALAVPHAHAGCLQPQPLPALADAAPLRAPDAADALRGLTLCIALGEGDLDHPARRALHYLARLCESAGARVAVLPTVPVDERPASVAVAAGAALLLEIGWRGGDDAGRVEVPRRTAADAERARLEAALVARIVQARVVGRGAVAARDGAPPVVALRLQLAGADGPRAHREPVHAMLRAIADWWAAERATAAALAPPPPPVDAVPRPHPFWPLDRPPATVDELATFVQSWRRAGVVDATQVWLDVDVVPAPDGRGVVLSGSTELPVLERALRRALARVGVEPIHGALRALPDPERVGPAPFGEVVAPSAQTWSRPGRATGLAGVDPVGQFEETELLRGEPVWLLDRDGDHLLVHAASGYLGWVQAAAIRPLDEAAFRARLGTAGDTGVLVARRALAMVGTPYLFGGRGPDGIDCSGLVSTQWATAGTYLPRDARQQVLAGRLVATADQRLPLEPGDLLFFGDAAGRISHVGMSLGGARFVHATPPEVTVGSLDPGDPAWSSVLAERFVLAKRVAR